MPSMTVVLVRMTVVFVWTRLVVAAIALPFLGKVACHLGRHAHRIGGCA